MPRFPAIAASTRRGVAKIKHYNADVIDAAGDVVEVAKKTEDLSATVVSKGVEKMYGKTAGIAAGAAMRSGFKAAEKLSAVHIAQTKKKVDWGAVATEGAADFAKEMVGMLLHGYLFEKFSSLFGSYLSKARFSEKDLADLGKALNLPGPLDPSELMTRGQKRVRDFLVSKAEVKIKEIGRPRQGQGRERQEHEARGVREKGRQGSGFGQARRHVRRVRRRARQGRRDVEVGACPARAGRRASRRAGAWR